MVLLGAKRGIMQGGGDDTGTGLLAVMLLAELLEVGDYRPRTTTRTGYRKEHQRRWRGDIRPLADGNNALKGQ